MIYIFDDSRKACRDRHYKAHLLFESWYLHRTFDKVINDCIYVLFICRGEVNYYSRHFNIDDNVLDEALMTNNAGHQPARLKTLGLG